ncbi:MAG TPA: ChaN family lipoprotein [Planctomycetota bacterium]|nr:ChaN family lipoprotein [Planctomycetota bacterium]
MIKRILLLGLLAPLERSHKSVVYQNGKSLIRLLVFLTGLASALAFQNACSTPPAKSPSTPLPTIELKDLKELAPAKLIDTIYSVAEKKFVSFDEMMAQAIKSPLIYVGETHDNVMHHQIQEQVLRAVYAKNGQTRKIALGMEMFQRPYQSILDDYLAGKISEPEMLRQTEYYTRWSFDWSMYQPMVTFARTNGLKVVALNAPREITKKLTKTGLASLTDEERKLLPEKIDTKDKSHRDYVYERFKPHIKMGMFTEEAFDRFYESQCLWEDTMADSAAVYFKSAPNGQEVVVVGGGHIIYRFGIPERAKWRSQRDYASILCVEVAEKTGKDTPSGTSGLLELLEGYNNNPADYLYFTKILKIDEIRPLMGVQLGEPQTDKKGLTIMDVVAGGPAAEAELMKDDVIIMVDNKPIKDMVDLKCALADKKANDKVAIVVQRGQETKQVTLVLELPKPKTE